MNNNSSKRVVYLDILRVIACFFVIANHSNFAYHFVEEDFFKMSVAENIFSVLYMVICKVAVTLFLMISGSLLLKKIDNYKKHLKRILRILAALFCFSILYYIIGDYSHSIKDFFITIIKSNVTTAFWYLYMYLAILVMLPLLQRLVKNLDKSTFVYYLILSLVLCSFSGFNNLNQHFNLPLFATFVGIFMAGYYVDSFIELKKYNKKVLISFLFAFSAFDMGMVFAYTYNALCHSNSNAGRFLVYDNIFFVSFAIALFIIFKVLFSQKENQAVTKLGSLTFGIYLLSDMIIKYAQPIFINIYETTHIFAPLLVLVLDIVVFAIGAVITYIFEYIVSLLKARQK